MKTIKDLLIEFDEMGMEPTTLTNETNAAAKWKAELVKAVTYTIQNFAKRLKKKAYINNYCQEIVKVKDIDELVEEYLK